MANKKANRKLSRILISSVFFIFLLLAASPGWADISNASVVISSDQNGDGVAGIGDTITISCRSTTTSTTGEFPFVTAPPMIDNLPLPQLAGSLYSAILTVSPGNVNGNITFIFGDGSNSSPQRTISVDNRRPESQFGPEANQGTGPGQIFKLGDLLTINLELKAGTADNDSVTANLNSLGLSANARFSPNGTNVFVLPPVRIPTGREGNLQTLPVSAMDDAGNITTWNTVSINYDTIVPVIKSVIITNLTSGKTYVTANDTIRVQATVSNFDNDTVVASNTILAGNNPITLNRVAGGVIGGEAVYEAEVFVNENTPVQNSFIYFDVTVTDDAGNSVSRVSNSLRADSVPPEFQDTPVIQIFRNNNDVTYPNRTGIIGDTLKINGNVAAGMKDILLTVDLSGIGGVSNQIIPFADNSSAPNLSTTTFSLDYPIFQYTSENSALRSFIVTAKDIAGNVITRLILPVIYVDNLPPTISAGLVQNISRPGQPARYGDQIAITATVGNIDNGSVWVDLRKLGGDASSTLSISGTSYRVDHVVTDSLIGGITDQSMNFVVYAVDDAGNTVQTVTNSLSIDNEPPMFLTATYTVNPVLSTSHPYVRVGDRLTFRAQLASSASSIYDGQTVKAYLNELGQANPVEMTYVGGYYTTSLDVQAGSLNYEHYFSLVATDNSGNEKNAAVQVKIDNSVPDVGPMGVNFLTDMAKTGAINVGDRLEFIIPVNDKDDGYCVLDLSMVGGSATTILNNYDPTLRRYYHVHDCASAPVENPGYVFRAIVYDKAFNTMNSLSNTFEVDCRLPIINSFSTTVQELKGKTGVINTGDKIKFTAFVDLSSLDSAVPTVNLSMLGGTSNQQLYDDGAHGDGGANDGEYSYTHTVVEGTTNGETVTLVLTVTDNAGNRVTMSAPTSYLVDNQSLIITSVTNIQKLDTNGNTIVDLDGKYTDVASFATDTVALKVLITGANNGLPASVTVDLTKFGYSETASTVPCITTPTGFEAEAVIELRRGNTNNEEVKLVVKVTDENGNETVGQAVNAVRVDNMPPTIDPYKITFVVDNGRIGEANRGDVIQVKVKVTNHDGMLPMIDFVNLYTNNGMTPPDATLFPPNAYGGNEYTYQWTVPEGLGTEEGLIIIALDSSGNMTYTSTENIMFLSKIPQFGDCIADIVENPATANRILNPGETVKFRCVLNSVYKYDNTPAAEVLVDIRSITGSLADDAGGYADGNMATYWVGLTTFSTSPPYVYEGEFVASASIPGVDTVTANFAVKILHPKTNAITMATSVATANPNSPFGIDTQVPGVKPGTFKMSIVETNGDNTSSSTANIGDILRIQAEFERFADPGSATVSLIQNSTTAEIFRAPMYQLYGSNVWESMITLATGTVLTGPLPDGEWLIVEGTSGRNIRVNIYITDDADNLYSSDAPGTPFIPNPAIHLDNNPPVITNGNLAINPNSTESWVANVGGYDGIGSGFITDGIVGSLTINGGDLTSGGMAFIDLTPIDGTATYRLDSITGNLAQTFTPFYLATDSFDLATRTFRLFARDAAGNRAFIEKELAVDSRRPSVQYANFDGRFLTMGFSEKVRPDLLRNNLVSAAVRIGRTQDLADGANPKTFVKLGVDDILFSNLTTDPTSTLPADGLIIALASGTKKTIADWGKVNLYLSISFGDTGDKLAALTTDEAGNWLRPVSRVMGNFPINITDDYTIRPNLVSGSFDAVNGEGYLYLNFDKDVDNTSLTADSLTNLAIWYNKGSSAELLANRYRMTSSDTYDPNDEQQLRTLRIKLSDDAQDWIALKYGRLASLVHLSVRDLFPTTFPPPLVRDYEGNKINPILPASAIPATLIPINTTFSIMEQGRLNLIDPANPILTITFERRARLFNDEFTTSKTLPADLSRVYIYEKADTNTGRSISLGSESQTNPMVDWARYKTINTYASTSILIPLSAEALKTMLSWGTSNFFLACSENAFRDLWGNGSQRFPSASNNALPVTIPPGEMPVTNPPTISSLAIRPVVKAEGTLADPFFNIFKIQPADGLIFEVAFDTATLSADVRIPIDRTTSKPTLKVETTTGTVVGLPTRFVGWAEHNQNGVIRTIAQFANLETSPGIDYDGTQVVVKVEGVEDIFDKSLSNNIATTAYDLAAKDLTGSAQNGFIVDRYPIKFDNVGPIAVSATSTSPIGRIGKDFLKVTVVFSEKLDATPSRNPVLRMTPLNSDTTIMNFTLESIAGTTAIYKNNGDFDSSITQGECRYRVSGGFDIVGNPGRAFLATEPVFVYSKGPNVKAIKVQTFQSTTAKANYDLLTGAPFSPLVAPGVATITVEFDTLPRDTTGYIHVYATNVREPIASLTAKPSTNSTVWAATWNGRDSAGVIVEGTHELRFYDLSNNEGSRRGTITVDSLPVQVKNWDFPNVKSYNGKAYFSPLAQSAVKMDAYCQIAGSMKMRLVKPGNSTDTYLMTTLSSSGYTVNFDGKSADGVSVPLDGEFEVSLVDLAGNVGTALPGGKATATLVIDRLSPTIKDIQMFRADGNGEIPPSAEHTTRFNPRSSYSKLKFFVYEDNSFAPMASGTGLIRIMAGSNMLKELILSQNQTGDPLTAVWDGTNKDGQLLTDGKYTVIVTDLAGNPAKQPAVTIDFVSSSFTLTSAGQSSPDSLRLVFSAGIASNTALNPSPFEVVDTESNAVLNLVGITISSTAKNVVMASFTTALEHDRTYRVTVLNPTTFFSEDFASMQPGDNVATFKADVRGPQIITNGITYDGITAQNKFNVVFDEQLEPISAATKGNYALTGTSTVITEVTVRADLKSVTITTMDNIVEGTNYRITVNGVKDLVGNMNSNAFQDFTGRDVTPPVLTVTAFSNPANEYDVVIVVKSNEELGSQPTATITQSGASAVSLLLTQGADPTTFIGGTSLNRNLTNLAIIKVTAKDKTGNTGSKTAEFRTAIVQATVRASVSSTDNKIEAVFEPGTLNKDTLVMIVPEDLKKTIGSSVRGSRIMPSALVGMDQSQLKSLKASIPANDRAAEELEPVALGYSLIIPAGRLKGSVAMSMKLEEQTDINAGVYHNDGSGWKNVKTVIENGVARFSAASAGTFALMRDIEAPRASILNDITSAPVRESRPVFTWAIEEFASGIAPETAMAVLDGRKYPVMLDETATVARFAMIDDLVSGEHSISLQIADKAGNLNVLPALRFVAQPPLKIHEVVQFPNPARNRVSLRISTNRNEVDAEEIRVKIYDTAGHLVAATNDLVMRQSNNGAGKVVQDVLWDLRNKDGKAVANGVYFARIEVRDPDNYEKKTRYTHKIAVLR